MRFVEVAEIPEYHTNCTKKDLNKFLSEFMATDIKFAHVILEDGDYSTIGYAQVAFKQCINRYNYPVKAILSRGALYLARTDYE